MKRKSCDAVVAANDEDIVSVPDVLNDAASVCFAKAAVLIKPLPQSCRWRTVKIYERKNQEEFQMTRNLAKKKITSALPNVLPY